jgi:TPR repeat protein
MLRSLNDVGKKYGINLKHVSLKESDILEILNSENLDVNKYDLDNKAVLTMIGIYYRYIIKNDELMIKYFEKGETFAMFLLGKYYETTKKDYDLMKTYYNLAIEGKSLGAMFNLAKYYKNIERNYIMANQCYLRAVEINNIDAMNKLKRYYKNKDLEFYHLLCSSKVNSENKLINDKISELKKVKSVMYYDTKIRRMKEFNNIRDCCICLELKLNIMMNCGHDVCVDCYPKINKCPECKCPFENNIFTDDDIDNSNNILWVTIS